MPPLISLLMPTYILGLFAIILLSLKGFLSLKVWKQTFKDKKPQQQG
ncbi:hypothetical protein BAZSYMA_ACONTIG00018_16 [Bathymodiolus azoricus thioautotrophic gill symbiont]|uniref:Uncharacterized protein n=1 Tax=Bathymodiolus azoricus thioautotrophic gill symbiont TaxID=235205 RepID=A0A1H6LP30_9GAMM|nr:hypothetical protein BAZSYMA_ACONTIG00018_16 [Bathymodiolus azoricus thioautotrophic gill symbiont]